MNIEEKKKKAEEEFNHARALACSLFDHRFKDMWGKLSEEQQALRARIIDAIADGLLFGKHQGFEAAVYALREKDGDALQACGLSCDMGEPIPKPNRE